MKIAFLLSQFPALSETFILTQITGLLDLGHEVSIFTPKNPKQSQVHQDVEKYQLWERISYQPDIPQNRLLRQIYALGVILSLVFICPIKLARLLRRAMEKPQMTLLRWLYWFKPLVHKHYDILHCHFGPMGNIGVGLKRAGIKGKLVTTFHGYDVTTFINENGPEIYNDLFLFGDLFTYNSNSTKEKIRQLGCPADRMVKLPMGSDIGSIPYKERKVQRDHRINILSVGRLVEMKGREYAISAVINVLKKHRNIAYNIVGDGLLRDELQNLIDTHQAQDFIKIHGWVDSNSLMSLYESSHIFLHPSVQAEDGNMEGQGVVLVEAQAHGLPIIATQHNAFPETVLDGISAYLVPEKDVDALVDKLVYLIENPQVWPEMGRCGREYVESKFDCKILNQRLVEIYESLLQTG